ncbi:MAG: DNA-directed RNA polymerase subunit H [Candidatus Aenigmatarchaeota archaeon]
MTNILNHDLVPKYEILDKKQKELVLQKFDISIKQLPTIFSSDPIIKLINAKVGDVVKIRRKSLTAGESIYYRTVVDK